MKESEKDVAQKIERNWNSNYEPVPPHLVDSSWKKLERRLQSRSRRKYRLLWSVAATLAILFTTYYFLEVYSPLITIGNSTLTDKEVILPDGSLVLLKNGSEIRYRKNFDEAREVALDGSAFFDIVKDSLLPFTVDTDFTTTKVLGTTFLVNESPSSKSTEISLYTGKVSMIIRDIPEKSWNMIAGERFVYENGITSISKFETEMSSEEGNEFSDFNNIELEKLFQFLEKRFDLRFVADENLANKRVTLRINKSDSLPEILKLLSTINHTAYEINKTTNEIRVFESKHE